MTLAGFAGAVAVSKPTQVAYEAGLTAPNTSYMQRVIDLGVDAYWVLTGRSAPLDISRVDDVFDMIGLWVTDRRTQVTVREMAGMFKKLYSLRDSDSPDATNLEHSPLKLVG